MDCGRSSQALVEQVGEVLPAFQKVEKSGKGEEAKEDPPANALHELLEGFPLVKVGVANYLPGRGPVKFESLVFCLGSGLGAEKKVESLHADRGIGNASPIEVEVNPLGRKSLPVNHTAEVDSEPDFITTVTVRGEEDMISAPGEGGLKVLGTGVEMASRLCVAEEGKGWRRPVR